MSAVEEIEVSETYEGRFWPYMRIFDGIPYDQIRISHDGDSFVPATDNMVHHLEGLAKFMSGLHWSMATGYADISTDLYSREIETESMVVVKSTYYAITRTPRVSETGVTQYVNPVYRAVVVRFCVPKS